MALRPEPTAVTSPIWRHLPPGCGFATSAGIHALAVISGCSTAMVPRSIHIFLASMRGRTGRAVALFARPAALAYRGAVGARGAP
jgi:hypothetical protein